MSSKPKRANLKPPGRCIFCGNFGLTGEHMYANWLRKYIPRSTSEHQVVSNTIYPKYTGEVVNKRTGDPHSRKIKCVCRKCNNEWMSQLQEKAKPFLVPIIEGKSVRLWKNAQTILAAWAAMTIMVAEHADTEMVSISAADRKWLKETGRAPSHWRIWIGHHARVERELFVHNVAALVSEEEIERRGRETFDGVPNSHASTICIGKHFLVHAMSSSSAIGRRYVKKWKIPEPIRPGLLEIWPLRTRWFDWPPKLMGLNDAGLGLLANEFLLVNKLLSDREYLLSS